MEAFWLSTGVIFVAELGDKSQLMALVFATRFRTMQVLIGITVATALVHAFSVLVGGLVAVELPAEVINVIAGLAFFAFAVWTIRGDSLTQNEAAKVNKSYTSPVIAVGTAFFLAELGDKTMLATVTLATTEDLVGTWIGSTVGMVIADALAILVGRHLGTRLPVRAVRVGAAVTFVIFGILLLIEGFAR